jgi:hypothetical protein
MGISRVRWLLAAATAMAMTTMGLAAASPAAAQETSEVFVVHGIPGQPVDVYVNGELTLDGFQPSEIAGPLELPAGSYDVALTAPGDPVEDAILTADGVEVPGGANLSVVAHLTEGGEPTLTPYVNDVSTLAAGQARVTARHNAAAPAVDVRANGSPVFSSLVNPDEATAEVDAGTVSADVVLAGSEDIMLGPADLDLSEGTLTIAYAIGSADEGTLELLVQVIDGLHEAPDEVPAGTGGHAAAGLAAWWYVLLGAAVLLLAGGLTRLAVNRGGAAQR